MLISHHILSSLAYQLEVTRIRMTFNAKPEVIYTVYKSCKMWDGVSVDRACLSSTSYRLGNLVAKSTPWTLCHVPQTISDQLLQHYPAERGHRKNCTMKGCTWSQQCLGRWYICNIHVTQGVLSITMTRA